MRLIFSTFQLGKLSFKNQLGAWMTVSAVSKCKTMDAGSGHNRSTGLKSETVSIFKWINALLHPEILTQIGTGRSIEEKLMRLGDQKMAIKAIKRLVKLAVAALGIQAGVAQAGTVNVTDTWSINHGIYSGQQLVLNYSYAELAPGYTITDLAGYAPAVTATATFLGVTSSSVSNALLVFSGSLDLYFPETYLTFHFAPNFSGLQAIDVWNLGGFGVFLAGASGLLDQCTGSQSQACGWARAVTVTPSAVPLPASGLLLGLPVLLGVGQARRRSRKSADAA